MPARVTEVLQMLRYHGLPSRQVGMISANERRLYADCSSQLCNVDGEIVDLGCWMGATSLALAEGIRRTTGKGASLHQKILAYDRFVWESWMDRFLPHLYCDYLPGESFLPEARRRLREYSGYINLIEADLINYKWQGGAIKLLLVDAMKSWELAQAITRGFFPSLSKGSILIHQDFKHFYTSWIHILHYRLRDYFHLFNRAPKSGTVAFTTVRHIPEAVAIGATKFEQVQVEEVTQAFNYSLNLAGECEMVNVAASHVMYYIHINQKQKAAEIFQQYCSMGLSGKGDMVKVEKLL